MTDRPTIYLPPELLEDVDGRPLAVGESLTVAAGEAYWSDGREDHCFRPLNPNTFKETENDD